MSVVHLGGSNTSNLIEPSITRAVPFPLPEEYEPLAAGSAEAQAKFLEGVGIALWLLGGVDSTNPEDICFAENRGPEDKLG